jgi:hypothetical protein
MILVALLGGAQRRRGFLAFRSRLSIHPQTFFVSSRHAARQKAGRGQRGAHMAIGLFGHPVFTQVALRLCSQTNVRLHSGFIAGCVRDRRDCAQIEPAEFWRLLLSACGTARFYTLAQRIFTF